METRAPRGSGHVRYRAGRWYIYWSHGGKRFSRATDARNRTEAREILQRQVMPRAAEIDRGSVTFGEFVKTWQEHRRLHVKQSTWDREQVSVRLHILPYFDDMKLRDITPSAVHSFVAWLSERKKGEERISPKSVNNTLITLHRLFEDAKDDGRVGANPVLLRKHRLPFRPHGIEGVGEIKRFFKT
jgi:hypothetical protein